ncbi:cupin domain-containing protein [Chloroflexota bacterium]
MKTKVLNIDKYRKLVPPEGKLPYRERIIAPEDGDFKYLAAGFTILAPGAGSTMHISKRDKIILCIDGSGLRQTGGKEFPMNAGDIFLTPADEPHYLRNTGETPLKFFEFTAPKSEAAHIEVNE